MLDWEPDSEVDGGMRKPGIRVLLLGVLLLPACFGSGKQSVWGIVTDAYYGAPTRIEIVTKPAKDGGVKLSTDVGKGKNAVALSAVEAARLIGALEEALAGWQTYWRKDPFERTLVMGVTRETDWTPYSVELIRHAEMRVPVFRVTIGRDEKQGSVELDEANARLWVQRLREASGYAMPPPNAENAGEPGPPAFPLD